MFVNNGLLTVLLWHNAISGINNSLLAVNFSVLLLSLFAYL